MINKKELKGLIERIIISENIRDMYQEEGRRKMINYYDGKVVGLYSALDILGYKIATSVGMVSMEREKKTQRKKEQEKNQKEEEKKDAQTE